MIAALSVMIVIVAVLKYRMISPPKICKNDHCLAKELNFIRLNPTARFSLNTSDSETKQSDWSDV